MVYVDTHTHLYLNAFDDDRLAVVENAINNGVKKMMLPNIDPGSVEGMHALCERFPGNCYPMIGLHPTSVKENYIDEIAVMDDLRGENKYWGIGETGIDLYWDTRFKEQQVEAFRLHALWAQEMDLPLIIHSRNSIEIILDILEEMQLTGLKGIFHCFGGSKEEAGRIRALGFLMGIGGTVTFKNSGLPDVLVSLSLNDLVLETDSPFLAPVPYRGKRNESAYIPLIARKLSEIYNIEISEVAERTTANALKLFNIESTNNKTSFKH